MLLEHSSFSFPTWSVPLLDLGLFLAFWALLTLVPGSARLLERVAASMPALPEGARVLALSGAAAALLAVSFVVLGPPIARVSDEVSYLFAAETFSAGKLTNPPLPEGRALAYEHVLDQPTRQSKYPPAQGLLLAAGSLIGHPALGLLLGVALLVGCAHFALQRFVGAGWAAVGAVFVGLRIGVGGYWHQSYWGGGLAAAGSFLVLAAIGRWRREALRGTCCALGAILLAAARPLEGLAVFVVLLSVLGHRFVRPRPDDSQDEDSLLGSGRDTSRSAPTPGGWRPSARALSSLLLVGLVGLGLLLGYNHAVTGSWWTHPHLLYSATEVVGTHFVWQETSSLGEMLNLVVKRMLERSAFLAFYLLGFAGVLATLGNAVGKRRGTRVSSDRRSAVQVVPDATVVWCALSVGLVVVVLALVRPFHAHYAAPAVAPLVLLLVLGARRLTVLDWRTRWPRTLVPALLASNALLMVLQLPAHRPDPGDWTRERLRIDERLRAEPGPDLVWVEDRRGEPSSWAFPRADPRAAEVLWVDGAKVPDEERAQWSYRFPGREVWTLWLEREGERLERQPRSPPH